MFVDMFLIFVIPGAAQLRLVFPGVFTDGRIQSTTETKTARHLLYTFSQFIPSMVWSPIHQTRPLSGRSIQVSNSSSLEPEYRCVQISGDNP